MQETFDRYINYLEAERNASVYTVRNYTTDLLGSKRINGFFTFLKEKGLNSLNEVNRAILRDYLTYLMEQGVVRTSIARKLSAIRSFYRYLLREDIVTTNPVTTTSSPKLDKRLPSFLSIEEVNAILQAPNSATPHGQRDLALLELLYASGLRVSELANLNLEQINLDVGEIRVWGKGNKERIVLVGKPAVSALRAYLTQGRAKLLGAKNNYSLFLNSSGQHLSERSIQRLLEKYAKIAGIAKRVYPHMVRHTFATHLLDGGADLRVVQELMGHTNLSSTQIYTHVTNRRARKVYLSAHPLAKEKYDRSK